MEKKVIYKDGHLNLYGLININDERSKTIAVICHARNSSKSSKPTTRIAEALNNKLINNFRFDFISCGESDGGYWDYTISKMIKNLHTTLDMLHDDYGFEEFILIGCSLGGRLISLVDHKKYKIKKLVLWYPALGNRSILNLPGKKERIAKKKGTYPIEKGRLLTYEYFKDERKYRAYRKLYHWDIPKLFVQGDSDQYVSMKENQEICSKCPNSEMIIIEDGDHGFHKEKCMVEALKKTVDFIRDKSK